MFIINTHVTRNIPHVQARVPLTCHRPDPKKSAAVFLSPLYYYYKYGVINNDNRQFSDRKMEPSHAAAELRSEFLRVLRSRRSPEVPLTVEPGKPVLEPMYQENPRPTYSETMASCPKANISNFKELLQEENFYLITEAGEQGRLPVIILSMKENNHQKRPAIVFLHSTNKCKEWLRPLLEAYASRGYIAIAIDSRYHGERASSLTTYRDVGAIFLALHANFLMKTEELTKLVYSSVVSKFDFATSSASTQVLLFLCRLSCYHGKKVWDLIKLVDYLTTQREDIDPSRIGITGESLGGMHAWFAAAADTRYAVAVPIIGVQGFKWAIDHDKWQARVDSIKAVFEEARTDLGKSAIDKEVVEKVWDRIAPGLASKFDAPHTIPIIAPRPVLILNGEEDPRCPLAGLEDPVSRACKGYEAALCLDNFKVIAEPGIGHRMTPSMVKEASDWFDKFLAK
ncbi:hypothetical protein LguiA_036375 [Lonicera macranthoides]